MRKVMVKSFALALVGTAMAAGSVWAIPTLTVSDGINTPLVATDTDGDGVVTLSGSLGGWFVSVSTGLTMPAIGSAEKPQVHLDSVNVSSSGAGTLTITWEADGFGPVASGITGFDFVAGGSTTGTVDFLSFFDDGSGPVTITTLGPYTGSSSSPASFSGSSFVDVLPASSPFSYGIVANLTHETQGASSFNAHGTVPEPATMLLFGTGLVGLVGVGRRMRMTTT